MSDISSLSDDDLKSAYEQPSISDLTDDELRQHYQKSLLTPEPVDDYGRAMPGSSPEFDQYLANSGVGHVLDAVGHGLKQGWGTEEIVQPDTADLLKKAGVFNDIEKGQTSIIRGFNEALLRPAAAGLDLAIRAGGQVIRGVGAAVSGVQAGIAQAGEELGAPILGRDLAGMIEAFPMGPGHDIAPGLHQFTLDLSTAGSEGVLGTEEAWKGIEVPTSDYPAGSVTHYPVEATVMPGGEAMQPYAAQLSPDIQPLAEPTNIHEAARQIAPNTFTEYDGLAQDRQALSDQIATQSAALRQAAEKQMPNADKIAALESRIAEMTPKMSERYAGDLQARIDQMKSEWDPFTLSALSRDTDELALMRQNLQQLDYRMRDLAPEVSAAYREAAVRFPGEEEAPPAAVEAPNEAAPALPVEAAAEGAQAPVEAAASAGEGAPEPAATPESIAPTTPAAPVNVPASIAEDRARQLVAAGRPEDEAAAAGAVEEALWRARAARFGGAKGTPEEMYAREGAEVRAGAERARVREMAQTTRGKIRLTDDGRAVITLFKDANASTFLHETGHDWLERAMRDAVDVAATPEMRRDAQTVRSYLGNDGGDLTTAQHEKFARSFERYFMEGRAPSNALASVFEKFKNWLTTIYQTVARLRAPITDDIRDLFDRMLTVPGEERPVIAPETQGELEFARSPSPAATPYTAVPKEPERLINFLRKSYTLGNDINGVTKAGGLLDESGEISNITGGSKGRPGLINNKSGSTLEDAAVRAWEAGYFPESGDTPMNDANKLIDAIREDHTGNPQYSMHDTDAANAYHEALARNEEIDRLSQQHGIETAGLTREQFFDKVAEKLSLEEQAAEIRNMDALHDEKFGELDAEMRGFAEPPWHGVDEPRTLEDLESAYRSEEAARSAGQGQTGDAGPGHPIGSEGVGEAGSGRGGRDAGDERRGGEETRPTSARSGDGGTAGPGGPESVSDGGPEPRLPPIDVESEPQDFRTKADREIEKAANIRLDKINTTEDMNDALRQLAEQNGDFMDARYGTVAYQTQMDIRNTRILLRSVTSDMMEAAVKAASGDPTALADYVTKQQRAAMVFSKLSTLSSDWAHAGHELNKVMVGFGDAKALGQNLQDLTGKTLFQIQRDAARMAAMPTAEQAGKFASELSVPGLWQKARNWSLSLFINNLISGPITHMAYMIGNQNMALYRAVPETAFQATISAIRQMISSDPITDRVYYREIAPQLYGMFKGARDGIAPALRALKTGVPELAGNAQSELAMQLNARPQVIPGRIGRYIEAPSRGVAFLHTLSYSMSYSQEIARLASRDAAARGLVGQAFNAEVARLTSMPTPAMMDQAVDAGMHGTLMQRPAEGGFQQDLVKMTNKYYPLKLAVPFMQIGTNILKEGIVDRSLLGVIQPEARAELMGLRGGAARDIRIGKIAAGSAISAAMVGLTLEGLATGGGPPELDKRRLLEAQGWKPYSLKIGNLYIPYRKFAGPLGPLMAAASDFYEIGHAMNEGDLKGAAAALTFGFAEVVADESWMSGISSLVDAVQDKGGAKTESYLRGLATSFIPFSVGMAQVARMVDPYQRRAQTILDAARNKIPFLSETLEPQIGVWGQPVTSHTMVSPGTAVQDPVSERMRALGLGVPPLGKDVVGIRLNDQQYTELARSAGMLAHQRLSAMVTQPGFADLPMGVQTRVIQETITKSRDTARALIKMQNPAIIQQATQNKMNLKIEGKARAPY